MEARFFAALSSDGIPADYCNRLNIYGKHDLTAASAAAWESNVRDMWRWRQDESPRLTREHFPISPISEAAFRGQRESAILDEDVGTGRTSGEGLFVENTVFLA
jgi:hypothetical protein